MNSSFLRKVSTKPTFWASGRSPFCGVDVELRRGDFLGLRGASGAGKSTLLHLLGGLDTPSEGEVWLGGRNLASLSSGELAGLRNREVGYIFQAYYLLPELDALENVCLPARMA